MWVITQCRRLPVRASGHLLSQLTQRWRGPGWEYVGELTEGRSAPCGDWDLGDMWECPFLVPLPAPPAPGNGYAGASTTAGRARAAATPAAAHAHGGAAVGGADACANGPVGPSGEGGGGSAVHALCVSPYPHTSAGRPTNPCLVWLGELTPGDNFLIEEAQGAHHHSLLTLMRARRLELRLVCSCLFTCHSLQGDLNVTRSPPSCCIMRHSYLCQVKHSL